MTLTLSKYKVHKLHQRYIHPQLTHNSGNSTQSSHLDIVSTKLPDICLRMRTALVWLHPMSDVPFTWNKGSAIITPESCTLEDGNTSLPKGYVIYLQWVGVYSLFSYPSHTTRMSVSLFHTSPSTNLPSTVFVFSLKQIQFIHSHVLHFTLT